VIKIAVVEDDIYLCEEIMMTFEKKGYAVSGISDFKNTESEITLYAPDLVVLDVNLPYRSGFEICKWLKAHTAIPILILTARDTLDDELIALGLGADDFLTKPCNPERLLARAGRLLQTYGKIRNIIEADALSLDTDTYKLMWKEKSLILPETEGKILQLLIEYHPNIVSQTDICSFVWGTSEFVDENILHVNITRLRKSLAAIGLDDAICSVRRQGYRLEVSD